MNPKYLNLSRSQLSVAWNRSRYNHYSDSRKRNFHDSIRDLYNKLIIIDFEDTTIPEDDLKFYKNVLEFLKDSLALLDNNTISSVPHEFIECLNVAAKEWIPDFDRYIIVMNDGPYAIMPYLDDIEVLYKSIDAKFNITLTYVLLSVSMPRQLSRDYFTNVCLFHELGHFIDTKYHISESVSYELKNLWLSGKKSEVEKWFRSSYLPFITPIGFPGTYNVTSSTFYYIGEYFADLFAAQYVGEKNLFYLDYLTDNPKIDSMDHPSYEQRYKMYQDYNKGKGSNIVLDVILEKTSNITKHSISKRFVDMDSSDIYGLLPIVMKNEKEIYSVFNMGWNAYMAGSEPFEKANNLSTPLPPDRLYEAINNLVEKSIDNYLVERDWEQAKKS